MKRETEEYFAQYRLLFRTPGWKQFMEDYELLKEKMEHSILYKPLGHDIYLRAMGELSQIKNILNFQEGIETEEEYIEYIEKEDKDDL